MERTLVLVKPDGVERRLVGDIISRFERRGLRLVAMRMLRVTPELSRLHYAEHVEKAFYPELEAFFLSAPVVAMVIEGERAIEVVRAMIGATRFYDAAPGTIRGDMAFSLVENLVHGSDSAASAAREIALWFKEDQLCG